ncbi:hypothetical protein E3N88_34520 [Mikania micrantha]|uniref:Uncharacterized protein n=1 Tax=Mikania micrantha TaxID=192012 RepID=A0A5N6LYD2_9ASTR|nr:hypothetical protein E3N88_34520 [Mikania micrantha]
MIPNATFNAAINEGVTSKWKEAWLAAHQSNVLKRTEGPYPTGGGDGEASKDGKKKFITKEEEPEQYWQTAGEREGENPMKTPLPYIIIFGMSTPFIILAIGFLNGWIKVPIR